MREYYKIYMRDNKVEIIKLLLFYIKNKYIETTARIKASEQRQMLGVIQNSSKGLSIKKILLYLRYLTTLLSLRSYSAKSRIWNTLTCIFTLSIVISMACVLNIRYQLLKIKKSIEINLTKLGNNDKENILERQLLYSITHITIAQHIKYI